MKIGPFSEAEFAYLSSQRLGRLARRPMELAEPLDHIEPPMPTMSPQVIRIHPSRILSWNVDPAHQGMWARNVGHPLEVA